MNLQNLRWPIIVATMAVTLGLLFGGSYLIRTRAFDQPLHRALAADPYVESVKVEPEGNRRVLTVRLKRTSDLEQAYTAVDMTTRRLLKGAPYLLKVEDGRTEELANLYRRVNLHVQESLVTGAFALSADRVQEEAARLGVTARITVDRDRVYLELIKGDAYLYSVTERRTTQVLQPAKGGFGL